MFGSMIDTITVDILGYWGGFPQPSGATAGIYVFNKNTRILIDCGSGVVSKFLEHYDVLELDAIILSHHHADHAADLKILQYKMNHAIRTGKRQHKLRIYAPATPELSFRYIQDDFTSEIEMYDKRTKLTIGNIDISFFENIHTIECYSITLQINETKITYCTDTEYQEELIDFVANSKLFICGTTKTEGSTHSSGKGHMSDLEAAKLASAGNVEKLVLFHLPSDANLDQMVTNAKTIYDGFVTTPYHQRQYILEDCHESN